MKWKINWKFWHRPRSRKVKESFHLDTQIDVNIRRWDPVKREYGKWYLHDRIKNLKPTVGLTFFLKQCYGSVASGTAMANTTTGCNFMALGTSSAAPAPADTILGAELDNTNGLGRAQATTTVAQPTATITHTWTATGAQSNVQEGGLFDTATINTGNLGHHFTITVTIFNNLDQMQIIVIVTAS